VMARFFVSGSGGMVVMVGELRGGVCRGSTQNEVSLSGWCETCPGSQEVL
jgi:hypothetical protein